LESFDTAQFGLSLSKARTKRIWKSLMIFPSCWCSRSNPTLFQQPARL